MGLESVACSALPEAQAPSARRQRSAAAWLTQARLAREFERGVTPLSARATLQPLALATRPRAPASPSHSARGRPSGSESNEGCPHPLVAHAKASTSSLTGGPSTCTFSSSFHRAESSVTSEAVRKLENQRAGRLLEAASVYGGLPGSPPKLGKPRTPPRLATKAFPRYLSSARVWPGSLQLAKEQSAWSFASVGENEWEAEEPQAETLWEVVEVVNRISVETERGCEDVPPRSWLVLDSADANTRLFLEGASGEAPAQVLLTDEVDGPCSPISSSSLKIVGKDRLTVAAAAANMRHAANGKSPLVLRHAAHAIRLLRDWFLMCEMQDGPEYQRKEAKRSPSEHDPGSEFGIRDHALFTRRAVDKELALLDNLQAYARRLEPSIQRMSLNKEQSGGCQSYPSNSARKPMTPRSHQPQEIKRHTSFERRRQLISAGETSFQLLKEFLRRRYGKSVLTGWLALEGYGTSGEGRLAIGEAEFYRGCERIGFHTPENSGGLRKLWKYLDQDTNGMLDICELNLAQATEMMRFKTWAVSKRGDGLASMEKLFAEIDSNRSGKVTLQEFAKACCEEYPNAERVFEILDTDQVGFLVLDHFRLIGRWHPPSHRLGDPNPTALADAKRKIIQRFDGSALRAWHFGLDQDGTMRLSFKEFERAVREVISANKESVPIVDLAGAWAALDDDRSGYVSLQEFDRDAHASLRAFKRWAVSRFGRENTVLRAFKAMDKHAANRITLRNFQKFCRPLPNEVAELIFKGLQSQGYLRMQHLRFLDDWDIESDVVESISPSKLFSKRRLSAAALLEANIISKAEAFAEGEDDEGGEQIGRAHV